MKDLCVSESLWPVINDQRLKSTNPKGGTVIDIE